MGKESLFNSSYGEFKYRFAKREEWYGFCYDVDQSDQDNKARERVDKIVAGKKLSRIPTPEDGKKWLLFETRLEANRLSEDIEKSLSKRVEIDHEKSFAFPVQKNYLAGWLISNDLPADEFPPMTESTHIFLNARSIPPHHIQLPETQMAEFVPRKNALEISIQAYNKQIFNYSLIADSRKPHPETALQHSVDTSHTAFLTKKYDANLSEVLAFTQIFQDAKNFRT